MQYGPMMFGKREPATSKRRAVHGMANQMAHERDEKIERDALKGRLASQRKQRIAGGMKAAARKKSERGMNAGTVGGSRR